MVDAPLRLTAAEIDKRKTSEGGWPRDVLAEWGVPWPPPGGWRKALLDGKPIPVRAYRNAAHATGGKTKRHRPPSYLAHKERKRAEKKLATIDRVDPVCVECNGRDPELVGGDVIYPHRPDLYRKKFLRCRCGAYVGCHMGTDLPLGHPAGPLTQRARKDAHAAFDPLWKRKMAKDGVSKHEARGAGYRWLAAELGIDPKACHIGWMNRETALRVVAACAAATRRPELAA